MFTGFQEVEAQPQRRVLGPRETQRLTAPPREVLARRATEQFMSRGLPVMPLVNQPFINLFRGPTTRLFDEPFMGGGAGGAIDVIEAARQFNPLREFLRILARGRP